MQSSRDAFEKDACPVGDKLLGDMYRSSEEGLAALVASVPAETRAMLALFCYRRSHLHEMAISIASTCEQRDLVQLGAALGSALYAMSRPSVKKPAVVETSNRRKITLSTKPLGTFAPIVDDLDEEVDEGDEGESIDASASGLATDLAPDLVTEQDELAMHIAVMEDSIA
jgi:hypothetical protein